MFVVAVLALSLLLVWADWLAYKRYLCTLSPVWLRRCASIFVVVANLLPYIVAAMMWLDKKPSMVPMMWVLTIYTVLSLSRLALYAGILTIKHKYVKWLVGIVLCVATFAILLVGVVDTRKNITICSTEICSEHLPCSFDGYRIALFSDLHLGSLTSAEEMCSRVVEKINSLDADIVCFVGDLVNVQYEELTPEIAAILGDIRARDGVVAVLGNHDTGVYVKDTLTLPIEKNTQMLKERISAMGWRVLDNATEMVVRGVDTITITGIGFSRELLEHRHSADVADSLNLRPIYDEVPSDKFNVTLSHMPQLWRRVSALGYGDLVLSGHVHAMQIKGRIGDFEFSPAQLMYSEWSGDYEENGSHLYITDGVGSVGFHLRIGAPPEITSITLKNRSR